MESKDTVVGKKKKDMGKIRIVFSSMVLFVLLVSEIYMMIHSSDYFAGLVTVTVLLIAVLYILLTTILQVNYQREQLQNELFEEIVKSEKASYLLMRKSFDELNERIAVIEENMKTPTEEIIEAQKAIAKVSISRSKENADALMNSNDKLLDKISNFEELLVSYNEKLISQQKEVVEHANKDIILKQQEAMAKITEAELSIKNEFLQSVGRFSQVPLQSVMPVSQTIPSAQEEPFQEVNSFEAEPEEDSLDDLMEESEAQFASDKSFFEDAEEKEDTLDEIPDISSFDDLIGEDFELEEQIPEESTDEEPLLEDLTVEELSAEEPLPEGLTLEEPSAEEPMLDELTIEDTTVDDNIPEESMTAESMEEESIIEEPVLENEEPVAEEKPPMPDLSDPNRIMTPDEIAALLANM